MSAPQIFRQSAAVGTMNTFGDRFVPGQHVAALDFLEFKEIWDDKMQSKVPTVAANFVILSSTATEMKVGSKTSEMYAVGKPGNKGTNHQKRFNGLMIAIAESLGIVQKPEDVDGKKFQESVANLSAKLCEIDENTGYTRTAGRQYTGRGIALSVYSKNNTASKGEHAGKVFCNQTFSKVTQTAEQIKATRAAIEAPPEAKPSPAVAAASAAVTQAVQPASRQEIAAVDPLDGISI